ncbi:MAG: hypothetical protein AB7E15_09265, partial [Azospira sp.]
MNLSVWKRAFLTFMMATAVSAQAHERDIAAAAKRFFGLQVTAVHESLIPGLYGINTNPNEVGPRLFMDDKLTVYGNFATGYTHLEEGRPGFIRNPRKSLLTDGFDLEIFGVNYFNWWRQPGLWLNSG